MMYSLLILLRICLGENDLNNNQNDFILNTTSFTPIISGQRVRLLIAENCLWDEVDIFGYDTVNANNVLDGDHCRIWCQFTNNCDMWSYSKNTHVCYGKMPMPGYEIDLVKNTDVISGSKTCKIDSDIGEYDIGLKISVDAKASGRSIAVLSGIRFTECAAACKQFPKCVGFYYSQASICYFKEHPIIKIPSPHNVYNRLRNFVGELIIDDSTEAPDTTTTTSSSTSSTTSPDVHITRPANYDEYGLITDYRGYDFMDESQFKWETADDPTAGYVDYISLGEAQDRNLVDVDSNNRIILRSDSTNIAFGRGRKSIRLSTKTTYNEGLFVWKVHHMPAGCGNWSALWTVGNDWPNGGEIDVVEGVNLQTNNGIALHTGDSCNMYDSTDEFNGKWQRHWESDIELRNCSAFATSENYGCAIQSNNSNSYGNNLNDIGGGYFVMEMSDYHIRVWFFPMNLVPDDIVNGRPNTDLLSIPDASFPMGSNCNFRENFPNHVLVINNTFCGGYAGWSFTPDGCPNVVGNNSMEKCINFVKNEPSEFIEAFWDIEYIRIYQMGNGIRGLNESLKL